jgi:hypothetical protein
MDKKTIIVADRSGVELANGDRARLVVTFDDKRRVTLEAISRRPRARSWSAPSPSVGLVVGV